MHKPGDQRLPVLATVRALLVDRTLLLVLALALLLRLLAIIAFTSLPHPDDNFQLFEQAHRFLQHRLRFPCFGRGKAIGAAARQGRVRVQQATSGRSSRVGVTQVSWSPISIDASADRYFNRAG